MPWAADRSPPSSTWWLRRSPVSIPSRVAIVDERGDLLAGGEEKTGADAVPRSQENQTTEFEDRLRQRIENDRGQRGRDRDMSASRSPPT